MRLVEEGMVPHSPPPPPPPLLLLLFLLGGEGGRGRRRRRGGKKMWKHPFLHQPHLSSPEIRAICDMHREICFGGGSERWGRSSRH